MSERIHYTKPSITDLEVGYALDAARNGWGEHCYDYIRRFESAFRDHLGVNYAIATSSCTGALHLGLCALGIERDDEVILADTNWIASAAPITYLGAKPIFVDILPDTWCLDPRRVEQAITSRTKAVIAVHLYGNLCEMEELLEIGKKHSIPIVEDTAEAIGSRWHEQAAGSLGSFGVFSFHGTKTLTTGEGGMLVTNNEALYEEVLTLSNHGRSRTQQRQFWPDSVGFKYKMSNLDAAVGCGQLERVDELVARKREIFCHYANKLAGYGDVTMNPEKAGTVNGFWMPTVVFAKELGITREMLLERFKARDIDARVFFHPLSSLPMFSEMRSNHHSYDIPLRAINLPSYHDLTRADQDRVINVIDDILAE